MNLQHMKLAFNQWAMLQPSHKTERLVAFEAGYRAAIEASENDDGLWYSGESLSMLSDGFIDEVDAPFIAACNPKTIKQLVELTRLMKRAIKIEHDDHCNCADHILEAIEAFNNFERNL